MEVALHPANRSDWNQNVSQSGRFEPVRSSFRTSNWLRSPVRTSKRLEPFEVASKKRWTSNYPHMVFGSLPPHQRSSSLSDLSTSSFELSPTFRSCFEFRTSFEVRFLLRNPFMGFPLSRLVLAHLLRHVTTPPHHVRHHAKSYPLSSPPCLASTPLRSLPRLSPLSSCWLYNPNHDVVS